MKTETKKAEEVPARHKRLTPLRLIREVRGFPLNAGDLAGFKHADCRAYVERGTAVFVREDDVRAWTFVVKVTEAERKILDLTLALRKVETAPALCADRVAGMEREIVRLEEDAGNDNLSTAQRRFCLKRAGDLRKEILKIQDDKGEKQKAVAVAQKLLDDARTAHRAAMVAADKATEGLPWR